MPGTSLVRSSREGDQFHYHWAARRCLLLLSPDAALQAVSIEGASPQESAESDRVTAGEEKIDVGEYYGSENLEQAKQIRYVQLKHSTVRTNEAWVPSELEGTLAGFAARYKELQQRLCREDLEGKVEFWFVSNRPICTGILEAIRDAAEGVAARHPNDLKKLERFTGLNGAYLSAFSTLLRLEGSQEGLWDQRNALARDVCKYLPGADIDAPVQLMELVTRKALSESTDNPVVTRMDVLRALKTDENRVFPAPCLIRRLDNAVTREQEPGLIREIVGASGKPVIVHAAGGVGKTVFASRVESVTQTRKPVPEPS